MKKRKKIEQINEFKYLIRKVLNERVKWAAKIHGALNKSFINETEI